TFHIAPQDIKYDGLNFFNPQPVTPNLNLRSSALAVTDRLGLGGGVLQSTVATEGFKLGVSSQGTAQMVNTPAGNQGNYFSGQSRQSTRIEWIENYALKPLQFKGTHNIQFGTTAAHSEDSGRFFARPVLIKNTQGVLLRRINFAGGKPFSRSDVGLAAFGE